LEELFGKYRGALELGRGSMGVVYRALDPDLLRPVAIKVPHDEVLSRPGMRELFEQEARAVARLQHANIVMVHELAYDARSRPFLVMELLVGSDLARRLARGPMPLWESVEIVTRVSDALQHAHDHGIVHRDVKPANVFLTDSGVVKVMDFGTAHWSGRESKGSSRWVMGTADYMSPEQALGQEVDGRSDVFSAGSLLYRLLTGKRPFQGEGIPSVLHQVVHRPFEPVRILGGVRDPELERILERAMAKSPDDRYPSACELARDLRAAARGRQDESLRRTSGIGASTAGISDSERRKAETNLRKLLERCRNVRDFPALRQSAVDLMHLPEDVSAHRVAEVVRQDQALATRLLRVVNSAYFSRSGAPISSLSRAVAILGLDLVRNVCLSIGFAAPPNVVRSPRGRRAGAKPRSGARSHSTSTVRGAEGRRAIEPAQLSARAFFAATIAQGISRAVAPSVREDAFTCALLYQLPTMALAHHLPEICVRLEELVEVDRLSRRRAEERLLTLPLTTVGPMIASSWKLPRLVVDAMGTEEDVVSTRPKDPRGFVLAVTYLANAIVEDVFRKHENEDRYVFLLGAMERATGLTAREAVGHIERAHRRVSAAADDFGIDPRLLAPTLALGIEETSPREELLRALWHHFDSPPSLGDGDAERSSSHPVSRALP
jgi:eukaryotic-like serine/threonine-protein kinase